jgi:three-Cys-motif partner protein
MPGNKKKQLNLRRRVNNQCTGGCTKDDRKSRTHDGICDVPSTLDGKPVRCVGDWAYRKIHYLVRYFEIFSSGMKNRWKGLNYIELCAGPGRCIYRETREDVDGTALAIIRRDAFCNLKSATFIDYSKQVVNLLNERIMNENKSDKAKAIIGDYTNPGQIASILNSLPKDCLNLVFIDPTECSIPFSTIQTIYSTLKNVDFLINVALFSDIGRNLRTAILKPDSYREALQKYSSFLGDNDILYSQQMQDFASQSRKDETLRTRFLELYTAQFVKMGLDKTDSSVTVAMNGLKLYTLFFASKNARALDFWRKAYSVDDLGQTNLLSQLFPTGGDN